MRKLIVLIMTSVLATGAVANADTVNVVEDPADYISVVGIVKNNGDPLPTGDKIIPTLAEDIVNADLYKLRLEVKDTNADLQQVAVCLYDSKVITDLNKCGEGVEDYTNLNANERPNSSAWSGTAGHESAVTMGFIAKNYAADTSLSDNEAAFGPARVRTNYHYVAKEDPSEAVNSSSLTKIESFGGAENSSGTFLAMEFAFAPRIMAKSGADWYVRVVATYGDGTMMYLVDDKPYEIEYVSGFSGSSGVRGTNGIVDYGDVIEGQSVTRSEINTGSYFANSSSDISLEVDRFKATIDAAAVTLGLSGDAAPAAGEVSLACGFGDPTTFFSAIASSASIDPDVSKSSQFLAFGLSAQSDTGNVTLNDTVAPIAAQKHSCKFVAGTDLAVGTYDNNVTVGITKAG